MGVDQSWRLKVARAEKHLDEIKCEMLRYSESHPYDVVPARQSKRKPNVRRFQLRLLKQPDPMLAVVLGDFLYTLRSALDHIAGATVPSKFKYQTSFPIESKAIWKREGRKYIVRDPNARRRFKSAIRGMPAGARAAIERAQPYNMVVGPEEIVALSVLSRLENADKHRNLVLLTPGLDDIEMTVAVPDNFPQIDVQNAHSVQRLGNTITIRFDAGGPCEDGTELFSFTSPGPTLAGEMHMHVRGRAAVAIYIPEMDGHLKMPDILDDLLDQVEMITIPELEPFVRN
jgi:hypothetical protein